MPLDKIIFRRIFRFVLIVFIFLTASACSSDNPVDPDDQGNNEPEERGSIVSSTSISSYSPELLQTMLDLYEIDLPTDLTYNVQAYKIVYQTIDHNGNAVQASGALFVPVSAVNIPLLSAQHGTQPERNMVASVNPLVSLDGIIAASIGYAACVPDFLGLGVSNILHPYLHEATSASSVIDMIRAAKEFCADNSITLNGQLFLAGYSEGGYVTMAAHKEMQTNYSSEFTITACAPMAGPYDLMGTADELIGQGAYGSPTFISFLLLAYNEIYQWNRLNEIFQSPYNTTIPQLFDGTHSTAEINLQLPTSLDALFTNTFLTNYSNGTDTQLISALESNSLLDWAPAAPVRLFHGDADLTVPYQNALTAYQRLTANGATNIDLITILGGDHATSVIPCIIGMVEWFESFRNTSQLAKAN